MSFVTVMATSDHRIEKLTVHHINAALVSSIKDHGSWTVELVHNNYGGSVRIDSPISVVVVGHQSFFVSGTADELEARFRT